MDLGAAAEGIARMHQVAPFMPSLLCSLLCGFVALLGWVGRERGPLIACLVVLLANQALLVVFGAWQVVFSSNSPDDFVMVYAIVTLSISVWAMIGVHKFKGWA